MFKDDINVNLLMFEVIRGTGQRTPRGPDAIYHVCRRGDHKAIVATVWFNADGWSFDDKSKTPLPKEQFFLRQAEGTAHVFHTLLAEKVAIRFTQLLAQQLTEEEQASVIRLNKCELHPYVCHTHDFCDANMPMAEAFTQIVGFEPDSSSEVHATLWGTAWDIAKSNHFFNFFKGETNA